MNTTTYLTSYGWKPGTGLKKGGIAKPILVSHKKDKKGLGNNALDHESWWERVFDSRLQGLDVYNKTADKTETTEAISIRGANDSPLYKMFVKGEGLQGSIGAEHQRIVTTATTSRVHQETAEAVFDSITKTISVMRSKRSPNSDGKAKEIETSKDRKAARDGKISKTRKTKKVSNALKEDGGKTVSARDLWVRSLVKEKLKKDKKKSSGRA